MYSKFITYICIGAEFRIIKTGIKCQFCLPNKKCRPKNQSCSPKVNRFDWPVGIDFKDKIVLQFLYEHDVLKHSLSRPGANLCFTMF